MFEAFSFLQLISLFITSLLILNIFLFILNVSLRLLKEKENNKVDENGNLKLMAIIGSGGHTTEMLKLLISTIDSNLFSDRIYVIADSDKLSYTKVSDFEKQIGKNNFLTYKIPRARNVGQSYCSSILTTLIASWHSAKLLRITSPDLILCNGPAICLPICLFARLFNFLRIKRIKIIFVESICRVQTLSLTGRILYHLNIPDAFLVQWPSLKEKYNKTQFIGRLV